LGIVSKLSDVAIPLIVKYYSTKLEKIEAPRMKHVSYTYGIIVFLIVAGSLGLVYVGKLDSSSFTLLIGVVVGHLMTFARQIFEAREEN